MCNLKWSVEAGGVLENWYAWTWTSDSSVSKGPSEHPVLKQQTSFCSWNWFRAEQKKQACGGKLWRWADRPFTSQSKASPYLSQALSSGNGVWSRAEASSLWDSFLPGFRQYKGWTLLCFPAVYIFSQIRNQRPAQITMVGTHFLFSSWGFRSLFSQSKVRLLLTLARGEPTQNSVKGTALHNEKNN